MAGEWSIYIVIVLINIYLGKFAHIIKRAYYILKLPICYSSTNTFISKVDF